MSQRLDAYTTVIKPGIKKPVKPTNLNSHEPFKGNKFQRKENISNSRKLVGKVLNSSLKNRSVIKKDNSTINIRRLGL